MSTTFSSYNARTGEVLGTLAASTTAEIDTVCAAASAAFPLWQASSGTQRAALLRALAAGLEVGREALVALADQETALGPVRLNGELDRTAFQLRRFADIAERGVPFEVLDDPAVAGAPPAGHPAMQRWSVPVGPVAMYAASNFPFAFSVLGGDTASALAAGCPVVIKGHPGHPQLTRKTWDMIQQVLAAQNLPAGLVGLVQGASNEVGVQLVRHPAIAAAAFTGSTCGGAALAAEAAARPRPIPFYGELGSINPVIALSAELKARGAELAVTLAGSITLGCGQFCTNPGVIVLLDADAEAKSANDVFVQQLGQALAGQNPHAMLTPGMRKNFDAGVAHWGEAGATFVVHEVAAAGQPPRPVLAQVSASDFIAKAALREEVFGPSSLVVRAASVAQALQVLQAVGGSLTVTVWGAQTDSADVQALVRGAMAIAGRVLFAGVPTGVAVTAAQQHGGPWPSSTRPESTSVGDAALARFLRPVSLQDAPAWLTARQGRPL
ncbi:MAG: aldehyde dehydrogenase (NADP(+)) [Hylemonella sp.]|uniref:aldehyde dehydrogenase (NADP(+)) n=1 Tax=Hylemonella sp. TaxID=2066020 RepID=UPI00391D4EDE